jgi:drug/metabolite transporter (DMT)-like permease
VLVLSQLVSIVTVFVGMALLGPAHPRAEDFEWGAAAGLVGGAGLVLFYKGLATGVMSVVAPITGVAAIAVPVVAGLVLGERPGHLPLVGVALAVVAVVCVSIAVRPAGGSERRLRIAISAPALGGALLAGAAFGCFYVLIRNASPAAGLWPLFAARATSVVAYALAAAVTGRSLRSPRPVLPTIAWVGVIDMTANICLLLAIRQGMLSIVGTLASLYPAATLLLARVVLKERLGPVQGLGLVTAAAAVVLISAG